MQKTDLLFGIVSKVPSEGGRHFFLADFDDISEKTILRRIGRILFDRHRFGVTYLIKSGRGWHVASFSVKLTLPYYARILEEMKADSEYIRWVKKVRYGVLRVSRRSSHGEVPFVYKVLVPPWKSKDDLYRDFYINLLSFEDKVETIRRVRVVEQKELEFI